MLTSSRTSKNTSTYRTISEVGKELGVATHVLRFWESKFSQVKPLTRAGSRRYYTAEDISLLRRIQSLLHDEGYTIKGAQAFLASEKKQKNIAPDNHAIVAELKAIRQILAA